MTDNSTLNAQAQRVRGAAIRAAREKAKAATEAIEKLFILQTHEYRKVLDPWRRERIAQVEADYQEALRKAHPAEAAVRDSVVFDAEETLARELEAAEAQYRAFLDSLREKRERDKRAAEWPELRAQWLDRKVIIYSLKETVESDQYRIERGLMDQATADRALRNQADMLLSMFPDKLEQDGETEWAKQLMGLTQ